MQIRFERNRTSTIVIMYSLYLYFLGLSLRNTSKALTIFKDQKRSYVSVWNWIKLYKPIVEILKTYNFKIIIENPESRSGDRIGIKKIIVEKRLN